MIIAFFIISIELIIIALFNISIELLINSELTDISIIISVITIIMILLLLLVTLNYILIKILILRKDKDTLSKLSNKKSKIIINQMISVISEDLFFFLILLKSIELLSNQQNFIDSLNELVIFQSLPLIIFIALIFSIYHIHILIKYKSINYFIYYFLMSFILGMILIIIEIFGGILIVIIIHTFLTICIYQYNYNLIKDAKK